MSEEQRCGVCRWWKASIRLPTTSRSKQGRCDWPQTVTLPIVFTRYQNTYDIDGAFCASFERTKSGLLREDGGKA